MPESFADWLEYIQALHPREMELGLERVARAHRNMGAPAPAPKVVVVAGSNGKGSCIAALERMARAADWRVGAYTSPHLRRFTERLRVDGAESDEADWRRAFAAVEAARDEPLTFFEFTTLAALRLLADAEIDLALLEIGLGGRGDAVNIISADVAALVGVDLEHTEILGADRERIGAEKAAIFRRGRPAVCGDREPPRSVRRAAEAVGAQWFGAGEQFDFEARGDGGWRWRGRDAAGAEAEVGNLPAPRLPASAVGAALQVWRLLRVAPGAEELKAGVEAELPGRWQRTRRDGCELLLDVAHNPAAARALAGHLRRLRATPALAVCGMLADKDARGFARELAPAIETWFVAAPSTPRAASAEALASAVRSAGGEVAARTSSVATALTLAARARRDGQLVVVCGSFYTVAEALADAPASALAV